MFDRKEYYQKNIIKMRKQAIESYHRHKEYYKQYWKNNPEKRRTADLLHRYGITPTQYLDLYNKQKGNCLICGKHQTKLQCKLAVDHSHLNNKIRGLLCRPCNAKLGWYERWQQQVNSYLKDN